MDKPTNYISDYKIIQLLGEGSNNKVFLGQKGSAPTSYAIKIFDGPYLSDPSFQRRLQREFRVATKLAHPNLVKYFEMGELNKHPFIVMEYLGQATLERLLAHHGRAPVSVAVSIMNEILGALSFLHTHQIIHRDIKPSAIFLTQSGRVVLADFDIAKPIQDTSLTIKGGVIGSPRYMAPEQRLGENATIRSDIFSAGVTLYEMLTGTAPWKDLNHLPTDRRAWSSIIVPSKLFADIPSELDQIVLKAIDLQPGRRFGSADEMAEDLKKLRFAPRSDLAAWASGRKANLNLNVEENIKAEERIKIRKPADGRSASERKKLNKRSTNSWKTISGISTLLIAICVLTAGLIWWQFLRPETVYFQDDFSDQQKTTQQWTSLSGDWQILNGSYYCSASNKNCLSLISAVPEGNFTLVTDVYGQEGIDKSIYFGVKDQNLFRVSVRSDPGNQIILAQVNGGQPEKILTQVTQPISVQKWYNLKLVFKDQSLTIYLDGQLVASTENPIAQQPGGKIGLGVEPITNGTSKVNSAAFDNFEITIDQ